MSRSDNEGASGGEDTIGGGGAIDRSRALYEGMIAGLLGFLIVVVTVAALDVLGGRGLFYTPSLLGQILGGFGEPTPGIVSPGPVFAFNGLQVLVFVGVGMAISIVLREVGLHPVFWYAAFFALMTLVLVSFMLLALVAAPWSDVLSRTTIILADALAALGIAAYLRRAHPHLGKWLEAYGDPEYDTEEP